MLRRTALWLVFALPLLLLAPTSSAVGDTGYVYDNLQRSRDALLGQQADLLRARTEVAGQMDALQAKLNRLDGYLRQVDNSLRDVNSALNRIQ